MILNSYCFFTKGQCLGMFMVLVFGAINAQESTKGDDGQENLPVIMTSKEVTSKDIRSKKNIISTFPFQFTQKTLPIAYERILGDNKHGLMLYYYRVTKESINDYNFQYRYYFKESELKDFNFDQIHIKGFYMEYYTGLNFQYAKQTTSATLQAITIPIGARLQFKKGLNFSLTGMFGYGHQEGAILEPNFFSYRFLMALGYRF